MKARAIFLCWLLLLVPTLIVGALLFRLLSHERERLAQASTSAATEQARLVTDQEVVGSNTAVPTSFSLQGIT